MGKTYKLSAAATESISAIVAYSDRTFGQIQTDTYIAGLEASFSCLADFPGAGGTAFHIKAGLRRHRYKSHYIFYSEQPDHIRIEDIFHVSRDIRADMFEVEG